MYIPEIDVEKLKALYASGPEAEAVFKYFVTCRPDEKEVTVEDLLEFIEKKKSNIPRQAVVSLFKDLDKLGVGDFKVGRRTQKTRFISKITLASVGKRIVDEDEVEVEQVNQANQELEKTQGKLEQGIENVQESENGRDLHVKEASTTNQKVLVHSFPLRTNLIVELSLPVDLTHSEAERLSGFIKMLPFNKC
jgi:hypothetical protein